MKKSVIPDPFLTETKIEDDKGCILILACDGVTNYYYNNFLNNIFFFFKKSFGMW